MSLKIPVKDRIALYPGRVILTPVVGRENTYDMLRADSPVESGTPINKALLDQKAYGLTSSVTLYVSTTGSDSTGDGSNGKPYATIQKALDELPKCLQGYVATISVEAGTYAEHLHVDGFNGGYLKIVEQGGEVAIGGITVNCTSMLYFNLSGIAYMEGVSENTLFTVTNGGCVTTLEVDLTLECGEVAVGALVMRCSRVYFNNLQVNGSSSWAILTMQSGEVSVDSVTGTNNSRGLCANSGGVVRYGSSTLESTYGNSGATTYGY